VDPPRPPTVGDAGDVGDARLGGREAAGTAISAEADDSGDDPTAAEHQAIL